jgi:hypothetical protein
MQTPEEAAAYIQSQSACALIKAMGYQAENKACSLRNEYPKYGLDNFERLLDEHGIHHNTVMEIYQGVWRG